MAGVGSLIARPPRGTSTASHWQPSRRRGAAIPGTPAPTGRTSAGAGQTAAALRGRCESAVSRRWSGSNASSAGKCGRARPWCAAIRCSTRSFSSSVSVWNSGSFCTSSSDPNSWRYLLLHSAALLAGLGQDDLGVVRIAEDDLEQLPPFAVVVELRGQLHRPPQPVAERQLVHDLGRAILHVLDVNAPLDAPLGGRVRPRCPARTSTSTLDRFPRRRRAGERDG